ncbi:MAG: methyltransferase domain-containing protein [Nanoarchaeota archaeon]|nr:methyltransferase domain-containing protein [Nanoarchaeota archaeon]
MVKFNVKWYKKFIESTNEKDLLVSKISDLLEGKPQNSCLEIGLGISPYFAQKLSKNFKKYIIVEKRIIKDKLPEGVEMINDDWENIKLDNKFDVIIASHVIYYFNNKKAALEKMFNTLNEGGRIIFVINGKTSDYGPLKFAFGDMIRKKYIFTYDKLLKLLKGRKFREYTLPSTIKFSSFEDLFETLKLSFNSCPEEYEKLKGRIIKYLKENIKGQSFIIDQKLIEVKK